MANLKEASKKENINHIHEHLESLPPELKIVNDNLKFEKNVEEHPIPLGIGKVKVFGYETWDINAILKGNYWRRGIYTVDKIKHEKGTIRIKPDYIDLTTTRGRD